MLSVRFYKKNYDQLLDEKKHPQNKTTTNKQTTTINKQKQTPIRAKAGDNHVRYFVRGTRDASSRDSGNKTSEINIVLAAFLKTGSFGFRHVGRAKLTVARSL